MTKIFLVQISDLHTGSQMYGNNLSVSSGWHGHDPILCHALTNARRLLKVTLGIRPEDMFHVVDSGDLTRIGSVTDFDMVFDFLTSSWPPDPTNGLRPGLNYPSISAVPGNHDQWAGALHPFGTSGFNPFPFRAKFPAAPWGPTQIGSPSSSPVVELYGIDSNSGFQGQAFAPVAQGGSISASQLAGLRQRFPSKQAATGTVRVILCHHAFDNALPLPGPLDQASQDALTDLAVEYDVKVILTGHTHYIDFAKRRSPAWQKDVWEIRSATAIQGPPKTSPQTSLPPWPTNYNVTEFNGFLVHEIAWDDTASELTWNVHPFIWDGASFQNFPPAPIPLP